MKNHLLKNILRLTIQIVLLLNISHAQTPPTPPRKKIVILTCKGGYGHMAACASLKNILTNYDITQFIPLETLRGVKIFTFGTMDGEELYNKLLQNGWIRTINFMSRWSKPFIDLNSKHLERKIFALLQKEKPDLLISVMPFINHVAYKAARRSHIPYLFITLDADLTLWLRDLEAKKETNDMVVTVGIRTPLIAKQLKKSKIPDSSIKEVGIALRKDFFEPKDKKKIRSEWKVPVNKPVIMLAMGGTGSTQLVRYTRRLAKLDIPAHLLVCVGKNEKLIPALNRIKLNKNVSMSVIPFTSRISDLMAISDLFITRPSPNACNEAIFSGLPILIDQTMPTLFWERATIDIVEKYGKGSLVKNLKHLNSMVKKFLAEEKPDVKDSGLLKLPRFEDSIRTIVEDMIRKNEERKPEKITLCSYASTSSARAENKTAHPEPVEGNERLKSIIKTPNGNVVQPAKTC